MKNPLLPICILCFTLYSCQKDFSVEISSSELPVTNLLDSSTLTKYVLLDTTMASGLDTGVVVKYTYDNAKRLVKEDYAEYGNTGMPNRLYQTIFFYNGIDTLHYKKIETIFDLPGFSVVKSDTVYYSYAGGRVVSDSFSHSSILLFPVPRKRSYVYESDKIIETSIIYYSPTPFIQTNKIYFTKNNGNVVLQIDSINAIQNFAISYDTKKNPFYKMPIASVDRNSPYYHMELFNEEMVFEQNNPIDINQFSNGANSHYKYYYEYKPNGYPSVARVLDQNDPTNFYKVLYFYTQL